MFTNLKKTLEDTVVGSEIRLTTWNVSNPVNDGIDYLSTGAGFLPPTVCSSGFFRNL